MKKKKDEEEEGGGGRRGSQGGCVPGRALSTHRSCEPCCPSLCACLLSSLSFFHSSLHFLPPFLLFQKKLWQTCIAHALANLNCQLDIPRIV